MIIKNIPNDRPNIWQCPFPPLAGHGPTSLGRQTLVHGQIGHAIYRSLTKSKCHDQQGMQVGLESSEVWNGSMQAHTSLYV